MPNFNKNKMSSLKKNKIQKVHRERPQPADRLHLGELERKKEYKARAENFQKNQDTLKKLKRKAENRNPDEFYFNMVKTKKTEGDHQLRESEEPVVTKEQSKLMATQDKRYVLFRLTKELKKIEKLKKSLHLIDTKKPNKHTIFVDSDKEAESFDVAKFFDTHPAFLDRAYNRPTMAALKSKRFDMDAEEIQAVMDNKNQAYEELSKRIDRARELKIILEKLEAKLHEKDESRPKKLVEKEQKDRAAQYKFEFRRQK